MNRLFEDFFPPHVSVYITSREIDFKLEDTSIPFSRAQKLYWNAQDLPSNIAQIHQVHGDRIVCVDDYQSCQHGILADADGLVSQLNKCVLAVRTADCLSVFFYDMKRDVIGVCHAGWKGTKEQINVKVLNSLKDNFGSNVKDVRVAFGPCIRTKSYEVGKEFMEHFPQEVKNTDGKFYFDLAGANRRQLLQCGVLADNITDCGIDTFADQNYFSYRKEGQSAGRILSIIYKN